jgi:hypothetical protein
MKDFHFYFTNNNSEESQKEFIMKKDEPVWRICKKIEFETFKNVIQKYHQFEPWYVDDDCTYKRENFEDPSHLTWRCITFYILKEGQSEPDIETPGIWYGLKDHTITAVSYGRLEVNLIKLFYEIAGNLDSTLFLDNGNFVTPLYIAKLELRSKSDRPKLTQKQEEMLSEVDNDAAWVYIPSDKTQEIISYVGASSKESEIIAGLYKAFEKDFTGLATYQSHSIIFGKNLMTLSLPELKNSPKPVNDDIMHHVIWNLSIRFGEAQFYSYNEYEVWYIHYKYGELVYSGTNGDDGPSYVAGSVMEEIELSGTKVKELAEANGISIEDFLIGCMKDKIKCHLIEAKNGMQVWWDGIMDQVKKELKSKKS